MIEKNVIGEFGENVLYCHTYVWYYYTIMSTLSRLLSSRTRAEIFKILFGLKGGEVHLREIVRRSGLSVGAIQDEIKKLQNLDLIVIRRDGNRLYCRANDRHPLYPVLRQLVLKTDGLVDVLREKLAGLDIKAAFVYGSVAKGEETAQSDLDLFIVGAVTLRTFAAKTSGLAQELGREINPFLITADGLRGRLEKQDHFVSAVWRSPKLFIVGNEHELEAMSLKSNS